MNKTPPDPEQVDRLLEQSARYQEHQAEKENIKLLEACAQASVINQRLQQMLLMKRLLRDFQNRKNNNG